MNNNLLAKLAKIQEKENAQLALDIRRGRAKKTDINTKRYGASSVGRWRGGTTKLAPLNNVIASTPVKKVNVPTPAKSVERHSNAPKQMRDLIAINKARMTE